MARKPHTLGPLIGYHGCDRSLAEAVLAGRATLQPSINEYDWLGSGIYFWIDSSGRGFDWAEQLALHGSAQVKDPYVIGALIYPALCLNLTDFGMMPELRETYRLLKQLAAEAGLRIPRNTVKVNGFSLRRTLDCTVINLVHEFRAPTGLPAYDTVYGIFEEGNRVYPGSGFRSKTHVQIAVRNLQCIVGYFRVTEVEMAA